jgi:hypothetical protein
VDAAGAAVVEHTEQHQVLGRLNPLANTHGGHAGVEGLEECQVNTVHHRELDVPVVRFERSDNITFG